jgi:hypothetical protein
MTLMTIIIMTGVAVMLITGVTMASITFSRQGVESSSSKLASEAADGCIEEGLEQIALLSTYTGTGALTFPNGSCSYTVTNTGGSNRTVSASSTVVTNTRRVLVNLVIIGTDISIVSWQNVAN